MSSGYGKVSELLIPEDRRAHRLPANSIEFMRHDCHCRPKEDYLHVHGSLKIGWPTHRLRCGVTAPGNAKQVAGKE